ncbi:MAG: hypothetical protein R3F31_10435 [Verrucomicrobiales bacterium]|nr:hypothetical protein [Verrucomicrobiae bacterium]MCP5552459.1 hypothetical protein [Akkermansiaceae bacterium]HRX54423.1 hypothetical protein [Verrucomicrobiales bacterium]
MKILQLTAFLALSGSLLFTSSCGEAVSAKPYPLDTCLVSGEKLGEMGAPVVINHEGQEIKFCCKSCLPDFKEDPAKYLKKLTEKKD